MPQIEIGLDPELPKALAPALRGHLEERWPDVAWTPLRLPAARRDARDGPLLVVLGPGAPSPPGDPGELAVVRWSGDADAAGREPLFLQVDLELGRITTLRSGSAPEREVSPPPREVTRRALLQIPLPLGRPLPPVPWLGSGVCLHGGGCELCAAVCEKGALTFPGATAAIDPSLCTGCGACTAACPTGALQSAYLDDRQWRAALDVLTAADAHARLAIGCRREPAAIPGDVVSLPLGCIGEVGWHHLWTSLSETGRLPELHCAQSRCPLRGPAMEALGRLEFLRERCPEGSCEASRGAPVPAPAAAPRRGQLASSLRGLAPALASASADEIWPGLGWTVRIADGEGQCTLCGGCVHTCPTGALTIEEATEATALRLDAALCAGCGACSRICPEQVIEVSEAALSDLLGPREVFRAEKALCKGCGAPYEAPSFVAALRARMEAAGFGGVLVDRLDYCPECRAAKGTAGSMPAAHDHEGRP